MDSTLLTEIVAICGALGVPSIFAMTVYCIKMCMKYSKQLKILMRAQQAQMRSQLLKDYHSYMEKGYILDIELKDWENQYNAYHELGANGVLDNRYQQLLKLPNRIEN